MTTKLELREELGLFERGACAVPFPADEERQVRAEIKRIGAKSVLSASSTAPRATPARARSMLPAPTRGKRKHRPLADELLWHKVYERYINSLTHAEPGATKAELIESHLHILRPIAGRIAWKRCPKSFGIWAKEGPGPIGMPRTSLVHLVYELAAFGAFGLILAADRYNPKSGNAFITYANYWVKKFISLYLEEISSIVPRTGHMGDDEPRRSVMDLVDAALDGRRLYRGKAAGGMAFFDSALSIPGPNPGDKEIEVVGSEGITDPNRLDYLQRRVGLKDYPWIDMGAYQPNGALWPISELVEPARCKQIELLRNEFGIVRPMNGDRLALPGHTGGKADDVPPQDDSYTPEEIDAVEFTRGGARTTSGILREFYQHNHSANIWCNNRTRRR